MQQSDESIPSEPEWLTEQYETEKPITPIAEVTPCPSYDNLTREQLISLLSQEKQTRQSLEQELTRKDKVITYIHKAIRNQHESYSHRVIDVELVLSNIEAVFEEKEIPLNVAYTRSVIGLGHNTMADYLAAKAQAGGIEYSYATVKQGETKEGQKPEFRNVATMRPILQAFNKTDTKAAEATLKQREAEKKSQTARLEKLKQSLQVCPHCGDTGLHIGLVPICGACGFIAPLDASDPDRIVKAENVRILVEDEEEEVPALAHVPEPIASVTQPALSPEPEPMPIVIIQPANQEPTAQEQAARRSWLQQFKNSYRAETPSGLGMILETTPLPAQYSRGKIGVILDTTRHVEYFAPDVVIASSVPPVKVQCNWNDFRTA